MHLNAQVQGRHTHMGRIGPTHGRKPKNSKKGRRETSIFVNGHLKGAVGPIRPWVLANLVTALRRYLSNRLLD